MITFDLKSPNRQFNNNNNILIIISADFTASVNVIIRCCTLVKINLIKGNQTANCNLDKSFPIHFTVRLLTVGSATVKVSV